MPDSRSLSREDIRFWRVTFHRSMTTVASHALVIADTAEEAERIATEDYEKPFVSPIDGQVYDIDEYESVSVEPVPPGGAVIQWWEEPT